MQRFKSHHINALQRAIDAAVSHRDVIDYQQRADFDRMMDLARDALALLRVIFREPG